ncbi:Cathecol O-methyltransferase 1 [Ancistrocladus abbreviatus]
MASSAETKSKDLNNNDDDELIYDEEENITHAAEIADSMAFPMVMHAAIQLDLLEIIAKAGRRLSAEEIAAQLPTNNPDTPAMLDRMLRLLATYSVVTCSVVTTMDGRSKRLYGLAPVAKYFVRDEDGVSFGPLMELHLDKVFLESWSKLKDAVLEGGIPFNKVHGTHAFEYPGLDPRFNQLFNSAMFNITTLVMKSIVECYKGFENVKQMVDVGGGLGHALSIILSKYPNMKGINFDLPHVIQHAPPRSGVKHVSGDMFESVPSGDGIFMKTILHDWSDDHCIKLLKNCYTALPNNGKVIVVEAVVSEEPQTSTAAKAISLKDLIMMTQNPGGKERTQKEFQTLANAAGFTSIKLACKACNFWVMEFYK